MRRKLVLGVGLAALVGGSAAGQFAADRVPPAAPAAPPATLPGGLQPITPTAPAAPVLGGFQPVTPAAPVRPASPAGPAPLYSAPSTTVGYVPPIDGLRAPAFPASAAAGPVPSFAPTSLNVEIPTAVPKSHPWLIKPEHGPYFIMVKSYVRPAKDSQTAKESPDGGLSAAELAEGLAREIRETYRVQAFLFEYVSEERKAEERALIAARQKAQTEYAAQVEALKQKAQLQGVAWDVPDNLIRMRRHDRRDQVGVLVGGFQSEADALKALAQLKKWPTPKNEVLLDKAVIAGNGKQAGSGALLNPYANAFVVPNPMVPKAAQPTAAKLDPFLVRLNDGHPYNLLKATRGWTLTVKSFSAPVEVVGANEPDGGAMRKGAASKGADALAAGGEQAEALAKALRAMKGPGGQPLNLEAFVLHTRYTSLVTVGQFDGPDDPALVATKRLLGGIKTNVSEDQGGLRPVMNTPSLFDNMLPMPIPKP
jgi:hypothetical protein